MTIQIIPLSKLRLSPHNVRKSGAEDNLDELVANIAANGLLQNLIGNAAKRGHFEIFAGGRRLRALCLLAARGIIAKDFGVPVNVINTDAKGGAETSLAENFIRMRMTPTDECSAFLHFLGSDGDIDAVAKRFGQTRRFVEGRLRLATLAQPLFDALGAGDMTMEVAKAYAATPDQAKQLAVFTEMRPTHMRSESGSWEARCQRHIPLRFWSAKSAIQRLAGGSNVIFIQRPTQQSGLTLTLRAKSQPRSWRKQQ
jgi:ParB family transcriptional regulator, chromosome partitioning protein